MKEMKIKVFSQENVEKFVTEMPYILISVRDPGSERVNLPDNPNCIAQLFLEFDDVDFHVCNNLNGFKTFTDEDAASILKVVGLTFPYINLIVVNSEVGINRSAGIAAALSVLLGIGDEEFFNPNGPYQPNKWVYRTILNQAILEDFHVTK